MSVSADDVRRIYESGKTDDDIDGFIADATLIAETIPSGSISDDRRDKIILYLTCHLLVLSEDNGGLRRQKMGDSDESYVTPDTKMFGYSSTRFGQLALSLDTTGSLAASSSNQGVKAEFRVV